jgi:membrane-associated phospholipid phosphatase
MSVRGLFALQDCILLGYLVIMRCLLAASADVIDASSHAAQHLLSAERLEHCIVTLVCACMFKRGWPDLATARRLRLHGYRIAVAFVVVQSYLMLRELLPLLRKDAVDGVLLSIDHALFGVQPALWLERFNQRGVVEWFSFFYFSYFFICAAYIGGMLWLVRPGTHTSEFAIGSFIVLFAGQLSYVAVPGYGPVVALADQFQAPLEGGFFWHCVETTVQSSGAHKDIFPSLHTAIPTFFALFSWRAARTDRRWRIPAFVTSFFAVNIIISTMLLRWHYGIDVLAGLCLAGLAAWLAPRLAQHDARFRQRHGMPNAWPELAPQSETA